MRIKDISLKTRFIVWILPLIFVMGLTGVLAVRYFANDIVTKYYADMASKLATTVSVSLYTADVMSVRNRVMDIYNTVDEPVLSDDWGSPEFDAYIALFSNVENMPEFNRIQKEIRKYQDVNDMDCIYVACVDPVGGKFIYLVDGSYEDACPPGCIDPIYDINKDVLTNPDRGFPPYVTDSIYGQLITTGVPIYDHGEVIAYAMADISMSEIRQKQMRFVIFMAVIMFLISLITVFGLLYVINRYVLNPIGILSDTARGYCSEGRTRYHHNFEQLSFPHHDEMEQLLESMQQMERDMNLNIEKLMDTKWELKETKAVAEEMTDAAMKDPLTGVGSKVAYEKEVDRLGVKMMMPSFHFGIVMIDLNFLKRTNDTYGHDIGDMAISSLALIICDIFRHSSVYRIGGDEFVVIVQGEDYEYVGSLLEKIRNLLNETDPNLAPYEAVSAAVGYAEFTDEDNEYKDVFKRADDDMYTEKKRMHGGRE